MCACMRTPLQTRGWGTAEGENGKNPGTECREMSKLWTDKSKRNSRSNRSTGRIASETMSYMLENLVGG